MPVTLTIDKLVAANVCRDGQQNFRRKFGRTYTWQDRDRFISQMVDSCDVWNWDEAVEKFCCDQEIWQARVQELRDLGDQDDDVDDDDDNPRLEIPSNTRGRQAYAWAEQYWDKENSAAALSDVPKCARAYLAAVDALDHAQKFHRAPPPRTISVEFTGGYADREQLVRKTLGLHLREHLKTITAGVIVKLSEEVKLKKLELEGALAAERTLTIAKAVIQPEETLRAELTPAP